MILKSLWNGIVWNRLSRDCLIFKSISWISFLLILIREWERSMKLMILLSKSELVDLMLLHSIICLRKARFIRGIRNQITRKVIADKNSIWMISKAWMSYIESLSESISFNFPFKYDFVYKFYKHKYLISKSNILIKNC